MSRTELAVFRFLRALGAPRYEIGIGCERGGMLPGHDGLTAAEVLKRLSFFRYRNSRAEHIYVTPAGEHACTLLDDFDAEAVRLLHREGFAPLAVVETSPKNFQAWLRHTDVLPQALSKTAARVLAARFGGDPGAADWRHFGRMPGFTNPKPKHRRANGQAPFVLLCSHIGTIFPEAIRLRAEIEEEFAKVRAQRGQATHACRSPLSPPRGEEVLASVRDQIPGAAEVRWKSCAGRPRLLRCRPLREHAGKRDSTGSRGELLVSGDGSSPKSSLHRTNRLGGEATPRQSNQHFGRAQYQSRTSRKRI